MALSAAPSNLNYVVRKIRCNLVTKYHHSQDLSITMGAASVSLFVGAESMGMALWSVAFMPYGVVLKDERRTSNVQHRTSNNDVAPLRNLISFVFKNPRSKLECLFLFLHLFPFNVRCWTFDVRCSFFSVPPEEKQLSAYSAWKEEGVRVTLLYQLRGLRLSSSLFLSITLSMSTILVPILLLAAICHFSGTFCGPKPDLLSNRRVNVTGSLLFPSQSWSVSVASRYSLIITKLGSLGVLKMR